MSTTETSPRTVPVIEISGWDSGDPAARTEIVEAVRSAATTYGFMQITGHGIPRELIDDMLAVNDEFFALPQDVKDALISPAAEVNRGYVGHRLGVARLQPRRRGPARHLRVVQHRPRRSTRPTPR